MIRILVKPQVFNEHVFLPPLSDHPIPERITNDPGLFPFFKSVLGAIDGSHVPAHVPSTQRDPFWNRKGYTSFNVLAACYFDLCFIYVLSGWEGSASDSYLWQKAIASALKLPEKRRLLADAGFGFSRHLLVPYRGVRYHLKEYEAGTKRCVALALLSFTEGTVALLTDACALLAALVMPRSYTTADMQERGVSLSAYSE